jgi:diphthine synthase
MSGLSFIGLGLHDETDMSLKALDEAKGCDLLYAEFYTSAHMGMRIERIEGLVGKKVRVLKREDVEEGDLLIDESRAHKVGFLVPGDPMMATTHVELRMRAEKEGIPTRLIHGASSVARRRFPKERRDTSPEARTMLSRRTKSRDCIHSYFSISSRKREGL